MMINFMSRLSNYDLMRYDLNETIPLFNPNSTTDYVYWSYDDEPTPLMSVKYFNS